jgi:hypothetical protein
LAACGHEWPALRQKLREQALADNQVPDAWIAACVEHRGEHLATYDHGLCRLLHARSHTLPA